MFLIPLLLFLIPTVTLRAHTLYLKNGEIIVGKIISKNRSEIHIRVDGNVRVIPNTQVKSINFRDRKPKRRPVRIKKDKKKTESKKKKEEIEEETEGWPLNRWTVAGRSMLLPGWGHFATEDYTTGSIYAGLSVVALVNANDAYKKVLVDRTNYNNRTTINFLYAQLSAEPGDQTGPLLTNFLLGIEPYNHFAASVDHFNQSMQILAIVYGVQIAHAFYSGIQVEKNSEGGDVSLYFLPEFGNRNFSYTPDSSDNTWNPGMGRTGLRIALVTRF